MAKLHHITVTALKDNVSVITAKKKLRYRKVEGLEGGGMPEGQDETYESVHGITLAIDQVVEMDVSDAQLAHFQAAVDAGDLEVVIHEAPQVPSAKTMAPTLAQMPKSEKLEKGSSK
jgi:hypothetical protein